MSEYISNRQRQLSVGISSYTENYLVLDVIGNVNISGVSTLGKVRISSGIITATSGVVTYYGDGSKLSGITASSSFASLAGYANTAGIATVAQGLTGTPNLNVGIVTATEYYGTFKGTIDANVTANYANSAGISTYATSAGIATYATSSGIATYAISAGIATYATSAGIATYATSSGIATYATSAGIATHIKGGNSGDILYQSSTNITNFVNSSVATAGQVLIWDGTIPLWANVTAASGAFGGITVRDEGNVVGTSNSITTLNFVSPNLSVTATSGPSGIATIVLSSNLVGTGLSFSGISTLGIVTATDYYGIFKGTLDSNVTIGYASTAGIATVARGLTGTPNLNVGIVTATEYYGTFKGTIDAGVTLNNANYANYANIAGIATYATSAGIATYATSSGIATYATSAGIATYATSSGIATYASISGIATYATSAGIATYASISGIATYATSAGIATYATSSGISTYATSAGIATVAQGLTGTPNLNVGIVTATEYYGIFKGSIDANVTANNANYANSAGIATYAISAGVATALQNSRTFEITGDIVASPISFNGTGNVSLAATIQPNSVALGTDTTGDYIQSVSGTANQIAVTGGTGEGSTPVISIANNATLPGNVTIANDLQVNNNLNVTGNITIGGTTAYIISNDFIVKDADIVLGFTTDSNGNNVSNDTTANHGGVAIASTVGSPLVQLYDPNIGEINPATYKKIMWFKSGSFAGLNTDAWLINYAVGIGSTQFPSGTRLAAGAVQFSEHDLTVVRNINASGIVTASSFVPSSGYIKAPDGTDSFYIYSGTGNVAFQGTIGASQVNNASGFKVIGFAGTNNITFENNAYISGITTSVGGFEGNLFGNATTAGYASTAGISTVAQGLTGTPNLNVGIVTATEYYGTFKGTLDSNVTANNANYANSAGYATTAGIATVAQGLTGTPSISITNLNASGISTLGTVEISSGIITATSGVVTYYGDGSKLDGVVGTQVVTQESSSNPVYPTFANAVGVSSIGISTTQFIFIPSTGNVGVGTTNPTSKLAVIGTVTANNFIGNGSGLTETVSVQDDGNLVGTANTINFGANLTVTVNSGIASVSAANLGLTKSVTSYVATSNQTVFNANYNLGFVDVYLNGSKLSQSEYVATNGVSITLNEGASLGDVIEIISFSGSATVSTIGIGIATAGGTVGTGVSLIDFRGVAISSASVSSGIATINISGTDISPVVMGMIF